MKRQGSFFGTEALVVSSILNVSTKAKVCLFCKDNDELEKQEQILKFFLPEVSILKFPSWDCSPYDVVSPTRHIVFERLKCLSEIAKESIVLATYDALLQKVIPKNIVDGGLILSFVAGQKYNFKTVVQDLFDIGYNRMMNALAVGEFAVRGSIIDIVSEDGGVGYRLDFFGDRIESIRTFDITTQNSIGKVSEVFITPISEITVSEDTKKSFIHEYQRLFDVEDDVLTESVRAGKVHNGIEHFLPLFYKKLSKFTDYLDTSTTLILKYDYEHLANAIQDRVFEKYTKRISDKNSRINSIPPELLYEFKPNELNNFTQILLTPFENSASIFEKSPFENLYIRAKHSNVYAVDFLKQELANIDNKIIFCCYSNGSVERLIKILEEYDIYPNRVDKEADIRHNYSITVLPLEKGYVYKNNVYISEQELLGHLPIKARKTKKVSANVFTELQSLSIGELVVHIDHGIGRFQGLEQITVNAVIHDFIRLEYAGGDKLYVPVENLDLLTRYGAGEDTLLDRLGAVGWQNRKAKLKNKIKLSAEKLLKIAAERNMSVVDPIIADDKFYSSFVKKFPYAETEDQFNAIDSVINDLASEKPMDRLVCGDVGFGKTEVALRAAAAIVSSGVGGQVAVLVPTTLLARQHYRTFCERFSDMQVKIAQLSKFAPQSSIKPTKEGLRNGSVDIVIGTHMLLTKDMAFKNLKLLIIDEEQHFGVAQKERLKELKSDCHILTLSATPIPRTLQMSLFGIKDLSLIASPPVNRHPIVTHVMPFDIFTIREAIMREHYRGGRTFIVTPRIAFLDGLMDLIKEHIPEVKAKKAHGGMSAEALDTIMNSFYDGQYEVLVSTSIVESGLDIPFANTMIVDKANMFGLAQLYQIRGRVGRSNVQAYSYLTYSPDQRITDAAEKRLNVLASFEELGAGFSIASNDMDIRGYGNLLGDEQSGHVREVGMELYQHMLQEAIDDIKENKSSDSWSPTINIGISIQIPETYIPDDSLRINLYRKIASLINTSELDSFASEMVDRFGKLPVEVEHLFSIVKIKQLAKEAGVEKIDLGDKALLITFRAGVALKFEAILEFVRINADHAKLRPDNKLLITKEFKDRDEVVSKLIKMLSSFI